MFVIKYIKQLMCANFQFYLYCQIIIITSYQYGENIIIIMIIIIMITTSHIIVLQEQQGLKTTNSQNIETCKRAAEQERKKKNSKNKMILFLRGLNRYYDWTSKYLVDIKIIKFACQHQQQLINYFPNSQENNLLILLLKNFLKPLVAKFFGSAIVTGCYECTTTPETVHRFCNYSVPPPIRNFEIQVCLKIRNRISNSQPTNSN
eukprot:TRINITY_DN5259_c1_g1_i6.p4 TRINITY_DN5259_c1_g1~~TRINITY_DN5259_c1_g1_i6.p4  ORF type:complete len:205 (+),score=-13.25 TRINITY_DN5259_c1_g1_i6:705-1319(+)